MYLERVVYAKVTGPYRLWLVFSDGTSGDVDLKPHLKFTGVFKPLKDPGYFARAKLDPEAGTVVWPNEADIAPETLYDLIVGHCVHERANAQDDGAARES